MENDVCISAIAAWMSRPVAVDINYTLCSATHSTLCTIQWCSLLLSLQIFTWNLIHSFSIFSQRLLTAMDGLPSVSQHILHGWNAKIIVDILRNPHIWKGYRLQNLNHTECTSITAKIISRNCAYKELLCQSVFLVRKKLKLFCTPLSHLIFFFSERENIAWTQSLLKHQN